MALILLEGHILITSLLIHSRLISLRQFYVLKVHMHSIQINALEASLSAWRALAHGCALALVGGMPQRHA